MLTVIFNIDLFNYHYIVYSLGIAYLQINRFGNVDSHF
jgi:hypothetical protein